jgi:hypothetical protein
MRPDAKWQAAEISRLTQELTDVKAEVTALRGCVVAALPRQSGATGASTVIF